MYAHIHIYVRVLGFQSSQPPPGVQDTPCVGEGDLVYGIYIYIYIPIPIYLYIYIYMSLDRYLDQWIDPDIYSYIHIAVLL